MLGSSTALVFLDLDDRHVVAPSATRCYGAGVAAREFGIRDLRNHTTRVLDAVRAGEVVYLTNRGDRVAEIRAIDHRRPIDALIEKAKQVSTGDTGAFDELMAAKQADISAQESKEQALWG